MGISFEPEGFDKARKGLEDLIRTLDVDEFEKWCNVIQRDAQEICKDTTIEFKLEKSLDRFGFTFKPRNDKQIECVKQAILKHLDKMPYLYNEIFKDFVMKRLNKRE